MYFGFLKRVGKPVHHVRVEEDGSLAQCCELRMLLVRNKVHIESTTWSASKLNRIIERPKCDCHVNNRIGLGLQLKLPKEH